MLERTFTYEGYDGKTYTDTWGFYLSKADLLEINFGTYVGMDVLMQRLIETKNGKEIMAIVREFILKSVGRAEGKRFVRNEQLRDEFAQTEAFSELFTELVTDSDKAMEFVMAVVPREIGERMRESRQEKEQEEATDSNE